MSMQPGAASPEVVTFGETMSLMMPPTGRGIEHSVQLEKSFGGAESNVAIGLARLGHRVGWFSRLGKDPFGTHILKTVRSEGVDVSRVQQTAEAPTGLMFREVIAGKTSVYYYRRASAASTLAPEHLDADYIRSARILHVTGITPALSASCAAALKKAIGIAREAGVKVCFDPNLRLKLWDLNDARRELLELAALADYFLPGLDELKLLYKTDDFTEIVRRLGQLSAVSIVKGDGETYVVENGEITAAVPFFKVDRIVDTVGAGDGFCAGFLAGMLRGGSYERAAQIGNLVGSMVIQAEGDWVGIPTWEQVEAVLEQRAHVER